MTQIKASLAQLPDFLNTTITRFKLHSVLLFYVLFYLFTTKSIYVHLKAFAGCDNATTNQSVCFYLLHLTRSIYSFLLLIRELN